jgi:hypothetical protein
MSIEAHVEALQRRHRALETEITEAHAHPSIDDLEIVSLKRRKLLVKDELARLKNYFARTNTAAAALAAPALSRFHGRAFCRSSSASRRAL